MDFSQAQQWIVNLPEQKKRLGISIASVVAGVAILIGYSQSGPNALNYAEAEGVFAKWAASHADEALYLNMKEAMHQVPALQKKYETTIVQKLINTDKLDEALAMADRSLSRVKGDIPFHATFAEASLLIEQGKFQEALEKAVTLKEKMGPSFAKEHKGGSLLYMHNLLRIACLQQELKNRHGEKSAWEELETSLNEKSKTAQLLLGSFSESQVNLIQYIAERKKNLS